MLPAIIFGIGLWSPLSIDATITNLTLNRVVFNMSSFYVGSIVTQTYPLRSITQCASIAARNTAWTVFCRTTAGDCFLSSAIIPVNYNDGSGGGGNECYTLSPPLIDISTYHSACRTHLINLFLNFKVIIVSETR